VAIVSPFATTTVTAVDGDRDEAGGRADYDHFAEGGFMEYGSTAASVWLDTRRLDHLGPLLGLIGDKLSEVGGRSGQHSAAQIGEARLDLGIGERGVDLFVELVDDLSRRVPGRADAVPTARLIARHEMAKVGKAALGDAMRRLFDKGKIRLEEYAQSIASRWRSDLFIGHVGAVRDAPAPGGGAQTLAYAREKRVSANSVKISKVWVLRHTRQVLAASRCSRSYSMGNLFR
jgi:hypothetical protein